jgi:hypothetical protein
VAETAGQGCGYGGAQPTLTPDLKVCRSFRQRLATGPTRQVPPMSGWADRFQSKPASGFDSHPLNSIHDMLGCGHEDHPEREAQDADHPLTTQVVVRPHP